MIPPPNWEASRRPQKGRIHLNAQCTHPARGCVVHLESILTRCPLGIALFFIVLRQHQRLGHTVRLSPASGSNHDARSRGFCLLAYVRGGMSLERHGKQRDGLLGENREQLRQGEE